MAISLSFFRIVAIIHQISKCTSKIRSSISHANFKHTDKLTKLNHSYFATKMEEMQDAIEDAQYMNAMHDDLPRPTKAWKPPTAEEIQAYMQNLKVTNPNMLAMDGMTQGPLGFFLFSRFIEEQGPKDLIYIDFLQDVAIFRARLQNVSAIEYAQSIYDSYLAAGSNGMPLTDTLTANNRASEAAGGGNRQSTSATPKQKSQIPRRKVPSSLYHPSISHGDVLRESTSTKFFISLPSSKSFKESQSSSSNGSSSASKDLLKASSSFKNDNSQMLSHSNSVKYSSGDSSVMSSSASETDVTVDNASSSIELRPSFSAFNNADALGDVDVVIDGENTFEDILAAFSKGKENAFSESWDLYKSDRRASSEGCLSINADIVARVLEVLILFRRHHDTMNCNAAGRALKTKFLSLFNQIDEIVYAYLKHTYKTKFESSKQYNRFFELMTLSTRKLLESDFSLFRVLGRGGFGLVNGCKRAQSGKLFAMKAMSKKRIKFKSSESLCLNERNVLTIIESQYVVCMKYSFTTHSEVFMILDLMMGGDLGFHLHRKRKFTDVESKYYIARTVLGIGALHSHNIVYRDLKPENILMDENGRTKLSDMGLASRMQKGGITGTCGTRGYWAPEMLRRDAYGKREKYTLMVDWFSLGVCMYEFLHGFSPFRTEKAKSWGNFPKVEKADKEKAIDLAIKEMEPDYDSSLNPLAVDLIKSLLKKSPSERIGSKNGVVEIMSHQWFEDVEWDNLNTCKAPIVPMKDINMASQSEIGTFVDEKSAKAQELAENDHKQYEKWDYVAMKSFQEEMVEFLYFEEVAGPSGNLNNNNGGCCSMS